MSRPTPQPVYPDPTPRSGDRAKIPPSPRPGGKRTDIPSSLPPQTQNPFASLPPTQNPFAPRPTYRTVQKVRYRSPAPPPTTSAAQYDSWTSFLDPAYRNAQGNLVLQENDVAKHRRENSVNNPASDGIARLSTQRYVNAPRSDILLRLPTEGAEDVHRHATKKAQIVWNLSSTRDATVHLELGVEEDLETQLESFSRLKRLGHFREAEEFFQSNLQDYTDLGQVLAEYMGMLLEQGAFKRMKEELTRLRPSDKVSLLHTQPNYQTEKRTALASISEEDAEKLDLNIRLIEVSSVMCVQGLLQHELKEVGQDAVLQQTRVRLENVLRDRYDFRVGSTYSVLDQMDIQNLRYWLNIMAQTMRMSNLVHSYRYLDRWANWPYWTHLYLQLLSEERIWEFRDIFFSASTAFGEEIMWQKFLSTDLSSVNFFDKFLEDWHLDEYDESSYLAALDILSFIAQESVSRLVSKSPEKPSIMIQRYLEHGRKFSACIKENNIENMKSRPYMKWILAEEEFARKLASYEVEGASIQATLQHSPGLKLWAPLPVYVPISIENPGWHAFRPPGRTNDLLQTVLKVSRELEDHQLEAACLQEFIFRSEDPRKLVDQLLKLQDLIQGDIVGYTFTSLFKYLLASNNERRQALSEELAVLASRLDQAYVPLLEWCRRMIWKTLTDRRRVIEEFLFEDLPPSLQEQINLGDLANNLGPVESRDPPARPIVLLDEPRNVATRTKYRPWPGRSGKAPQQAQAEAESINEGEDLLPRAALYQQDISSTTVPLTAEALKKQSRPRSHSSQSTNSGDSDEYSDASWVFSADEISARSGPPRVSEAEVTREKGREEVFPRDTKQVTSDPGKSEIEIIRRRRPSFSPSPSPPRSASPQLQPPVRGPYIHQELVLYNRPLDYGFIPSPSNRAHTAEVKVNSDMPKKGKTRIPAKLVSKKAIIDLEYPFKEEGGTIIIQRNLSQHEVDELIKLSKDHQASSSRQRAHTPQASRQTIMNLDDVSIEVLHEHQISYSFNADHPKVITILRSVPQPEQDLLIKHTKVLREQRTRVDRSMTEGTAQQKNKVQANKDHGSRKTRDSHDTEQDNYTMDRKERKQSRIEDNEGDVATDPNQVNLLPNLKPVQTAEEKYSGQATPKNKGDTKKKDKGLTEETPKFQETLPPSEPKPVDDNFGWGSFSTNKGKKKKKGGATEETFKVEEIISPSEPKLVDDDFGWGSFSTKKDKKKKGKSSIEKVPEAGESSTLNPEAETAPAVDEDDIWTAFGVAKKKKKSTAEAVERSGGEGKDEVQEGKTTEGGKHDLVG